MQNIQAVIYDMDGVLINSEPLWREAEIKVFRALGKHFTEDMCKQTMGMRSIEVIRYWYERLPWEGPSVEDVNQILLNEVSALIQAKGEPMPGVETSLQYFKDEGKKLAVASSSPSLLIDTVVDQLGIRSYFNVISSAEYELFGKPHPAVFISTAEKLNTLPINCLVIEDSVNGVIAAKAALMNVVAVPDEEGRSDKRFAVADHHIPNLNELLKLFSA